MPSINSLVSNFLKTTKWFLRNEDTGDVLEGQFAAEGVQLNIQNNYAQHTALNRSRAIIQYLNSANDTLSFQAQFFAETIVDTAMVERKFDMLKSMARRDPDLGRPPIVTFWVGNGFMEQQSVIDSIGGVTFAPPSVTGAVRQVYFTVNLLAYTEFSLKDNEIFETRYHRSRQRDYYELLAQREYGDPMMGDIIRKRHPTKPNLVPGAVVKLPSKEAIRSDRTQPTSTALKDGFGRKDTAQKRNRLDTFNRRNIVYYSHVVKA
jgi:hypothetical protein